jgi:transposase
MKKEEKEYLIKLKTSLGKSPEEAYQEIRNLEKSRTDLKELNKEINRLKKENEKLNKKLDKYNSRDFKTQFKRDIEQLDKTDKKIIEIKNSKNGENAKIKDLNRIMGLIESEGKIGLSDLRRTCCMNPKICKECLNFLIRNNFIKEEKGERGLLLVLKGGKDNE